ncbi:MAG: cupin domain-containing protein [Alphaproteobacteria bacterium]|nr:cupin domain-containing protein [Alphaproteobacteria bacterium]
MAKPIDIEAELKPLKFLEGRNRFSDTTGVFARLYEYRDSMISAGGFSGTSQWERHPNGDEIVQILKGSTTVTLLTEDGQETHELKAGTFIVVPQNTWHQFNAPDGVTLMTTTPQPTEHIEDEFPPDMK